MAKVPHGVKILPKISIAWVGRAHQRYRRQTDRRQTDRSLKMQHILYFLYLLHIKSFFI